LLLLLLLPFILAPLPAAYDTYNRYTIQIIMQCTYYNTRLRPFFCSAFRSSRSGGNISLHLREWSRSRWRSGCVVLVLCVSFIVRLSLPSVIQTYMKDVKSSTCWSCFGSIFMRSVFPYYQLLYVPSAECNASHEEFNLLRPDWPQLDSDSNSSPFIHSETVSV